MSKLNGTLISNKQTLQKIHITYYIIGRISNRFFSIFWFVSLQKVVWKDCPFRTDTLDKPITLVADSSTRVTNLTNNKCGVQQPNIPPITRLIKPANTNVKLCLIGLILSIDHKMYNGEKVKRMEPYTIFFKS